MQASPLEQAQVPANVDQVPACGPAGLADKEIGTVDCETVFAALCHAAAEARRQSLALGLPVVGC